jgi:hypothetical protein
MAAPTGLEPATSGLTGRRSNLLSYDTMRTRERTRTSNTPVLSRRPLPSWATRAWWRRGDSNPLPPLCKSGALPGELHPHGASGRTRTGSLRLTRTAQVPTCSAGIGEPVIGIEPMSCRLQGGCSTSVSYTGVRTLGRTRTGTVGPLKAVPPTRLGYEGIKLGAEDSNLHRPAPEAGVLPVTPAPTVVFNRWSWSGYRESNPGLRHGKATHCRCATAAESLRRDSNPQPRPYQGRAPPRELRRHGERWATCRARDSNPQLPDLESGASAKLGHRGMS